MKYSNIQHFEILDEVRVVDTENKTTRRVVKLRSTISGTTGLALFEDEEPEQIYFVSTLHPDEISRRADRYVKFLDMLSLVRDGAIQFESNRKAEDARKRKESWIKVILEVVEGTTATDPEQVNGTQIDELARRLAVAGYVPHKADNA